ncbi:(2Fe-2S)-binding protein [Mesorhizobium sp. M5C.F.Cr.IN.023.01.1.1]|uniref:(2Fe-2S)-binding protein n=1 Tax=Mesorhizobium sp. M5C.F.Cr.IN.023.01.1.1 TaxID=2496768 RepID=UPI000FCA881C|nr:(2Fe-2S)-binding protein [Mesorhizobium sp. M5C.F.Cr.IN.023.01.1.1]RUV68126.1 (2Fe-2S)-binding protein [Mesorhizobium sp. M5C.F.Cr.IN.023.01.1.1]
MNYRPIFPEQPADRIMIQVNGVPVIARVGQSLALALLENGLDHFNVNPMSGKPRLPFCMMGACFECRIIVDGVRDVLACRAEVRDGMVIKTQDNCHAKV